MSTSVEVISEPQALLAALKDQEPLLRKMAPEWLRLDRLIHLVAFASRAPELWNCTKESWLNFALRCAETGLEPIGPGGCWAVPYYNSKRGCREVQFVPDYRGLIDLAIREGKILHGYADVIRAGDEWSYTKGTQPELIHKPLTGTEDIIAAYFVAILPHGFKHVEFMWRAELDAVRALSKAASGPWATSFSEMAKKTVVKRGMKPFMGAPRLNKAIEYDNQITGIETQWTPVARPKTVIDARVVENGDGAAAQLAPAQAKEGAPPPPASANEPPRRAIVELLLSPDNVFIHRGNNQELVISIEHNGLTYLVQEPELQKKMEKILETGQPVRCRVGLVAKPGDLLSRVVQFISPIPDKKDDES